ncbi:glycosyl hydrolase family 7-domain-containing protein [Mycena olivaceomarginata]|nr:glycosyl hydrolase family 7-domain-containing protein [Mycena olivaceomarginata]
MFYGPGPPSTRSRKSPSSPNLSVPSITSIKRFYVQNGKVIPNSNSNIAVSALLKRPAFGDTNTFASMGGLAGMSEAAAAGMVLVMSIWDDYAADMLWLDAPYPPTKAASTPGVTRGTCSASSGVPSQVESASPNAQVIYSTSSSDPSAESARDPGLASS